MTSVSSRFGLIGLVLATLLAACDSPPAARSDLVYVALGASDAVGVGADNPETDGWVPRLHQRMPPGARLVNIGVSGSELSEALDQQLPVALAARPDVVTVWLAVNDLRNGVPLPRYERDLDRMLGDLRATGATVLVGNVPDLASLPVPDPALLQYGVPSRAALRTEIARWNTAIARLAAEHGALLVDVHREWRELRLHPEYLSTDGFHPSTQGYARLARLWWSYLEPAMRT